jgi:hypothetical protein
MFLTEKFYRVNKNSLSPGSPKEEGVRLYSRLKNTSPNSYLETSITVVAES